MSYRQGRAMRDMGQVESLPGGIGPRAVRASNGGWLTCVYLTELPSRDALCWHMMAA